MTLYTVDDSSKVWFIYSTSFYSKEWVLDLYIVHWVYAVFVRPFVLFVVSGEKYLSEYVRKSFFGLCAIECFSYNTIECPGYSPYLEMNLSQLYFGIQ